MSIYITTTWYILELNRENRTPIIGWASSMSAPSKYGLARIRIRIRMYALTSYY